MICQGCGHFEEESGIFVVWLVASCTGTVLVQVKFSGSSYSTRTVLYLYYCIVLHLYSIPHTLSIESVQVVALFVFTAQRTSRKSMGQ